MPLCRSRRVTPLERHAKNLQVEAHAEAVMPFPMYTVPLHQALEMTCVEAHETLKARGLLVEFEKNRGKAMFLSHEWVGRDHPDPSFTQFAMFQDAMKHILLDRFTHIKLDYVTEALVPQAKPLPTGEFRSAKLFLWYDYFSCPQLEESRGLHSDQAKAIASIHAYVAKCSFFFALCPFLQDPVTSKVVCASSWGERGWCRLERTIRELSEGSWVVIKSAQHVELVVASRALDRPTGEGDFAVAADRLKLGPILEAALKGKMERALMRSDFVTYRVVRNLQNVYLRGLEIQSERRDVVPEFIPSCNADDPVSLVEQFLYQNGLWNIHEVDSGGFLPLHYAALGGQPQLIKAMLKVRADFSRTTRKAQPLLGIPPWASALGLALACGHNEAARILIEAKAKVQETGVVTPALHLAAACNNVEGIRLLMEVGCDPSSQSIFGLSAAQFACDFAALAALEELLSRGISTSGLLHATAESSRGSSSALCSRLIEMKADIDEQCQMKWLTPLGALVALQSLRYRWSDTALTRHLYHLPGSTPLMMAILSGNFEIAMTLLRAGARVDLRNARNVLAADLADGAPHLLQEILQGDSVFCRV